MGDGLGVLYTLLSYKESQTIQGHKGKLKFLTGVSTNGEKTYFYVLGALKSSSIPWV